LRLARHQAYLLQHAHEIVKKILFHDLALLVSARIKSAEIHVETLFVG
jgi:ABC-type cobalamin transport system ATPase subunit